MREQAVEADRDAEAGREITQNEDRELRDPDHPVPKQSNRQDEPQQRQENSGEVDRLVGAAERLLPIQHPEVGRPALSKQGLICRPQPGRRLGRFYVLLYRCRLQAVRMSIGIRRYRFPTVCWGRSGYTELASVRLAVADSRDGR